jgi:RNA polymerase sigma-70 factor (sigma-E family)
VKLPSAEQDEFASFVRARSTALLRTAHLLTGDRGHAEDLLQQALERLARHWRRIDGDPEAYVRRTLVNLATDRWRLRARRPREAGAVDDADRAVEGGQRSVEDRLDLVQAMGVLTSRQRAVLVLRYFDDLSEQDTAAVVGCSVGTVKSTTSRALAKLRDQTAPPQRHPVPTRSTT